MKRLILIASVVVGLLAAPTATPAAPSDAQGPPCGNITNGDGSYTGTLGGTATIDFTVFLAAPACDFVTYSFYVTDTSGTPIAATGSTQDDACTPTSGGGCVHFEYTIAEAPSTVCVYAETSIKGHLIDHAPSVSSDPSCPAGSTSLTLNGSGASGNFD